MTKEQIQANLNRTTTTLGGGTVTLPDNQGTVSHGAAFNIPDNPEPAPEPTMTDRQGMTATPEELKWTTEGAVAESQRTGEDWQSIQKRERKKVGTGNKSGKDTTKKYIIGYDDEGAIAIPTSPYLDTFGYKPNDPDFETIKSDLESKKDTIDMSIETVLSNKNRAEENISAINSYLDTINSSKNNAYFDITYTDTSGESKTKKLSKSEAVDFFEGKLYENQQYLNQDSVLSELQGSKKDLENQLGIIEGYEKHGYEVEITDDGYEVNLPSASDVHSWWVDDTDKEAALLSSAAFMKSPLAIGTVFSGVQSLITGDEKVSQAHREELAQYSLGLQETLKDKDYGGYIGKVATSPAMVQGVYLPALTMGAGYAFEGLSVGGSTALSTSGSSLANLGSTTAGKIINYGGKVGMLSLGAYGTYETAKQLKETYDESPETFGARLGETAFTFGIAAAGFKAGKKLYWSRHPIRPSGNVFGKMDVIEEPLESPLKDTKRVRFEAFGEQKVAGRNVKVRVVGTGEKTASIGMVPTG